MSIMHAYSTGCPRCGLNHTEKYHVKAKLKDKGFPTNDSHYKSAHEEADKEEKKKFPKGYQKMKKVDQKLAKNDLAGKNTKSGAIYVSEKVPAVLRKEVAMHEKAESKNLKRLGKK